MSTGPAGNRWDFRSLFWLVESRTRRRATVFILGLIVLLVLPWPGLFYGLGVRKGESDRALLTLPFFFRHSFLLSYTHPLYLVPVVEKFEAKRLAIYLREITTKKYAIPEFSNIPGTLHWEKGEVHIRDIQFTVPELVVTIGITQTQRLTWEDRVYPLFEMNKPGELLIFQTQSISPAGYLWQRVIN